MKLIRTCVVILAWASASHAQELVPRRYANAPTGLNFLALGYGFSTGNVLLDPAISIENLDADVHVVFARYTRTFGLFGRSSKVKVTAPFSAADWTGFLDALPGRRSATGFGDAIISLETSFIGAPALAPSAFASHEHRKTVVGGSLQVSTPTGTYDSTKLLNLGSNRWTFRPEVGVSRSFAKWTVEAAGSVWLFTDNHDFFGGSTLSQKPLFVAKGHLIRELRPGFWLAFGLGFGKGGQTKVNGTPRQTEQTNWRFGVTLSYSIAARHGLSVGLMSGTNRGAGNDFDAVSFAYQYAWDRE